MTKDQGVKNVCAGVVTYNPDVARLAENLQALRPQVAEVMLVDNGSVNADAIAALVNNVNGLCLIRNEHNLGIAKALNQLCRQARTLGYKWILTMDQDSVCDSQMVESLMAHADRPELGIIAPRVEFRDGKELILSTKDGHKDTVEVQACITSGSLTRLSAWKSVGGFDEWMFIDRVDNEFCTRLVVNGFRILRVNKAVMYQRAGAMKHVKVPVLGTLLLPYYSEQRNYYICRNTIYYFRKYRKHIDLVHQIGAFVYAQTVKIICESHRWGSIRSTYKGIRDGFRKALVI